MKIFNEVIADLSILYFINNSPISGKKRKNLIIYYNFF